MSENEGAARASAGQDRQPTPLFDIAPARGDPNRERTLPRGLGAHTTRTPLLATPAVDREDIETERRRRGSGSEERRTLRWDITPSPLDDGRHSPSSIRYDTESRFSDLPAHLRMGSRERATAAPPDSYAELRDRPTHTRLSRQDTQGRTTPPTLWDRHQRPHNSPTGFTKGRPRMDMNTTGENAAGQDIARNIPYYHEGLNSVRNLQYEPSEHRNMVGHEDTRNPYPSRNDARINIPPEAFAHQRGAARYRMLT